MRLEKIRLAGFKSFVDLTTVNLPSNLIGIVGPNGCGKSNVIDAVRWVMGESSARLLRGESMVDVIFNGSSGRQPLASASIELVFDNRDNSAGGVYSAFSQLTVKRQVARDGQSNYFLNGVRCRRRDIQELFLGTGLGPRSYAIIEQGMISRLIEARPDELRVFLEEAAGISKYKERRRETETRIEHTRDNLTRLDDLRAEVGKQLHHLERQASAAEKFTQLQAEEVRLEQERTALRWQALTTAIAQHNQKLEALATATATAEAHQLQLESDLTAQRLAHGAAAAQVNAVQTQNYAISAEIAQVEQAIVFAEEVQRRHEVERHELEQMCADTSAHLAREQQRHAELAAALAADEPAWMRAEQELTAAEAAVAAAEERLRAWETHWDDFNHAAAQPAAEAHSARVNLTALEQQLARDEEHQRRVHDERRRLEDDAVAAEIAELVAGEAAYHDQQALLANTHRHHVAHLAQHDATVLRLSSALDHLRSGLQESKGRLASLTALQEAALNPPDAASSEWLARSGLSTAPRLVSQLQVEPGWELATETVLGTALRAVASADLDHYGRASATLPPGITLLDPTPADAASPPLEKGVGGIYQTTPAEPAPDTLAAQVHSTWSLRDFWHGVRIADDVATALAQRSTLAVGERFITRDGVLIGRNWLQTAAATVGTGVLARGEAIDTLRQMIADGTAWETSLVAELSTVRAARVAVEQARVATEQQQLGAAQELARVRAQLTSVRAQHGQQQERLATLTAEGAELVAHTTELRAEIEDTRDRLYDLLTEVETLAEQRGTLLNERDQLRSALTQARALEQQCRAQGQKLRVLLESHRVAQEAVAHSVARAEEQQQQLVVRGAALALTQAAQLEPVAVQQERREHLRVSQVESALALQVAQQEREALEVAVLALEQERLHMTHTALTQHQQLEMMRLAQQERVVRAQTLAEQLAELGVDPAAVAATALAHPPVFRSSDAVLENESDAAVAELADAPSPELGIYQTTSSPPLEKGVGGIYQMELFESRWREALVRVRARLHRLGAVNLAAVDEFKEAAARQAYLTEQTADITAALATLEQAMRKIDRDTRSRFRETFEKVNHEFQQLFPQLFGGGTAQLELTAPDVLEAGVRVLAQPPGKRNTTIHLLSGGEKALTAVALVFAIFHLNPAPFCLLDEVDAPLDDANVERFCALLRTLAQRVQFIFISHNRVTMEVAEQLIGVTMHEPGVSRLVAVDVAAAVALTTAS
jgi:chromosome segregation protein